MVSISERKSNIAKVYRLLDRSYRNKENTLLINKSETEITHLAKYFLSMEIVDTGNSFYEEARFIKNGGRADLVIRELAEAWEVLDSESMNDFVINKSNVYPITVIPFRAKKVVEDNIRRIIKKYRLEI